MRYQEILEACWTGYQQQGMKKKGNRQVPNCVPVSEQEMEEDLKKWFKEKWVRFGPDGKIRGDCARGSSSEGKPKCLPQSKAHALGKKGRASSAAKKRREDPNPERRGAAKNVATRVKEQGVAEGWKTGAALGGTAGGLAGGVPGAMIGAGIGAIAGYFMKGKDPKKIPGFVDNVGAVKEYVLDRLPKTSYGELVMSANPQLMDFTEHKFDNVIGEELIPEYFIKKYGQEKGSYIIDKHPDLIKALYLESQGVIRWIIPITITSKKTRDHKLDLIKNGLGDDPKYLKYFGISQSDEWGTFNDQNIKEENQNDRNARIIAGEIEDAMSQGNEKLAQQKIKQLIGVGYTLDKQGRLQRLGMYEERDLQEKQDACYRKVKSRYKVWPSAYASGALVQCRKKGAANWGNKKK